MLIVLGHSDINTKYFIRILKNEPAIIWKLVTCQRITSKEYSTWIDTVRWYWSADTLFWQLSIDNNIDVQSVFSWAPWAPKVARKCESKHFYFFGMGRFTYPWCSAGALRARSSANIIKLVYMKLGWLSHQREFTPVPSCGSVFAYCKIPKIRPSMYKPLQI